MLDVKMLSQIDKKFSPKIIMSSLRDPGRVDSGGLIVIPPMCCEL